MRIFLKNMGFEKMSRRDGACDIFILGRDDKKIWELAARIVI